MTRLSHYKRSLAISRERSEAYHSDVAASLNSVADLRSGRYGDAEPLWRSVGIRERSEPTTLTWASLSNLAALYMDQGRYAESRTAIQAQPLHPRQGFGARPSARRYSLTDLAELYRVKG
jgi:hypothetical protein